MKVSKTQWLSYFIFGYSLSANINSIRVWYEGEKVIKKKGGKLGLFFG